MAAMLARTMFPGLVSLYEILDSGSRGGGHTLERKPAGGYERCALYNLLTADKYALSAKEGIAKNIQGRDQHVRHATHFS